MTSFNYDDKARDVGLTCWCHQSNNMSDSIFHERMRQRITCVCLFFVLIFVWLAFSEIWRLKLVRGFQTKNFIVGFLCLCVCVVFNLGCCVFIQYNLAKGCCERILIQLWNQVIDYSLPGLTWHTRLRIGISHLSISGIVVHGRCYISHCFYFLLFFTFWLFVGWYLFVVFVFMFFRQ